LYFAIFVNYYLLESTIPSIINWFIIIGIVILGILELILCYVKYGNYVYEFYDSRISVLADKKFNISYASISKSSYSHNILDKWFKTGSILLELNDGKKVKLKYLTNSNQAYFLIQKSHAIKSI
jgi:hypothetical protein